MIPLFCEAAMTAAHDELRAIGRLAGERTVRDILRMELPIEQARDHYAQQSAATQEMVEAYMVAGHPALRAIVGEILKHAAGRVEELIGEQQTCEASAAAPS